MTVEQHDDSIEEVEQKKEELDEMLKNPYQVPDPSEIKDERTRYKELKAFLRKVSITTESTYSQSSSGEENKSDSSSQADNQENNQEGNQDEPENSSESEQEDNTETA